MKFDISTILLGATLLSTTSFCAPLTSLRQAQHEARLSRSLQHYSNPPLHSETQEIIHLNSAPHVQYSQNWAGAVLIGTGYTSVSGVFTVPTPQAPNGSTGTGSYAASAWVGIDGDTWNKAILQTGIDFIVKGGNASFSAWYEWYPQYAYDFTNISISAGDEIKVSVQATSTSTGFAVVENLSTGVKVSHEFFGGEGGELGELNAEWIVEDFQQGLALVDFANFGTVSFRNACAVDNGTVVGPSAASLVDIKQRGIVLTSSSVTDNTVVVSYQ
ncbi:hypothetical protein N7528_000814 [Penicillium herquei]|nr:hypothetical protein N7528_000814 [Penicillium herquei]